MVSLNITLSASFACEISKKIDIKFFFSFYLLQNYFNEINFFCLLNTEIKDMSIELADMDDSPSTRPKTGYSEPL